MDFQLIYKTLSHDEAVLFLLLCNDVINPDNVKKSGTIELKKRVLNLDATDDVWANWLRQSVSHLLEIKGFEEMGTGGKRYFTMFQELRYKEDKKEIYYSFTDLGFDIVSRINQTLNIERMDALSKLNGKYDRRLAMILLQHYLGGYHEVSVYELVEQLELPHTYENKELFRTVLKPAISRIEETGLFENLHFTLKGHSQKTRKIAFEWQPKE